MGVAEKIVKCCRVKVEGGVEKLSQIAYSLTFSEHFNTEGSFLDQKYVYDVFLTF